LFKWWRAFVTFNLVCFAWILFRAQNLTDTWWVVRHLFTGLRTQLAGTVNIYVALSNIGISSKEALLSVILIVFFLMAEILGERVRLLRRPLLVRWAGYYALVVVIWLLGKFGLERFVYLQF
jgi:hypothetical protein